MHATIDDRRSLVAMTFVAAVSRGVFLTCGVLYFTQVARFSAFEVGLGLSIGGCAAIVGGVLGGHLADRVGARLVVTTCLGVGAAAAAAFPFAQQYWIFQIVVAATMTANGALLVAQGPIINHIGGEQPNVLRTLVAAVLNAGVAVGAAMAGWAAQVDTPSAYDRLIVVDCLAYLGAAILSRSLPDVTAPEQTGHKSKWPALRDRPYLALSALDGVLSLQNRILTVALPLWIVAATHAPRWTISASILLNTAIVVLFQVRVGKQIVTVPAAGIAMRRAGSAFCLACIAIASAAGIPASVAAAVLAVAVVVHSVGELWQAAGGFELSNGLAPAQAIGQYLGVFGMGFGLAEACGPVLLTWLCLGFGKPGWYLVGAVLAVAGTAVPRVVRRAEQLRTG